MRVQYCFKLTRLATKDLTQPEFSRTMLSIVCVMKKKRKKKKKNFLVTLISEKKYL